MEISEIYNHVTKIHKLAIQSRERELEIHRLLITIHRRLDNIRNVETIEEAREIALITQMLMTLVLKNQIEKIKKEG